MLNNGPWGIQFFLDSKPHQEHILNIKYFICIIYISYHGLNKFMKRFKYPILCCNDVIHIIVVGASCIYIITVDAKRGYHQISLYSLDKENLEFFVPNNSKYTFKVMPFGPINDPVFYTFMMQYLRGEWHILFMITVLGMDKIGGQKLLVTETYDILVGGIKVSLVSKRIIYDIIIWSTNM